MEALSLYTRAPKVHSEDNTHCISVVGAELVTPRNKHIGIPVWFLQEQFDNWLFIQKYDNCSVMPEDMCTKSCSVPIISHSNKWMTGLKLYPTSDTEHDHIIILY